MPASLRDLASWQRDLPAALAVLRYMSVGRVSIDGPPEQQILVRATISGTNLPWEPVRADLERIWRENLSEGLEAVHTVSLAESLFLSFSALSSDRTVVTGRIWVART